MSQSTKQKVLFICTHNSARSQMAEALLRMLYGNRYESYSAGISASYVDPYAVKVMEELGADMSGHRSKSIDELTGIDFDYVITTCDEARESCPYFPGRHNIHHSFSKASKQGHEAEILVSFRSVRDEIKAWIESQFAS